MKDEHHVKIEKGTLLAVAVALIAKGAEMIGTGATVNGVILIIAGLAIMFAREHFKFHRWSSMIGENSYWRDKRGKRGM